MIGILKCWDFCSVVINSVNLAPKVFEIAGVCSRIGLLGLPDYGHQVDCQLGEVMWVFPGAVKAVYFVAIGLMLIIMAKIT